MLPRGWWPAANRALTYTEGLDPFDGSKNMHLLYPIIVGQLLYGIYDLFISKF